MTQSSADKRTTDIGSEAFENLLLTKQRFCFNDKCEFSKYQGGKKTHYIDIETNDCLVTRINRHVYKDKNGDTIFLCSTCHEAIQLIIR